MSWDAVIGQKRVKDVLQTSLAKDRIPHAYLFYGPYGVGKRAMALELAKALQCETGGVDPCDACANCSRIDRMIHPDVRFFLPITSSTTEADVTARLAELAENPYATVDFVRRPKATGTKQVLYPVSFIRDTGGPNRFIFKGDVKRIIDYKSFEGRYKVIVILGAESLQTAASNAFLKMLEEPSERTVFMLLTERPDQLLPTILSRCQPVRFDPLSADDIAAELLSREGLESVRADTLSRLADGSYSSALDLIHDEESGSFRGDLVPFMRSVYANNTLQVLRQIDDISAESMEHVKLFLSLLAGWIRDLILIREIGEDAPIVNVDLRGPLLDFCANLEDARLAQMVDLIEEAVTLISRNVRAQLVLTALAAGLRRSMYGKSALPLLTPLADQLVSDTAGS